jgi:arsenate reductase (glutaredoxin)
LGASHGFGMTPSPTGVSMTSKKTITVYGIPNCQSVKKSRTWLEEHDLEYVFHDFKKSGVPAKNLKSWVKHFGWESVLNRKGTTWRTLSEDDQAQITNATEAIQAMMTYPSLIKRPVIEFTDDQMTLGVNPEAWRSVIE